MPAYILSVCEITEMNDDFKRYAQLAAELSKAYGGEYVIRGKAAAILEGKGLAGKAVVLSRFPSMEKLRAFYDSDEYQNKVKPLRAGTGIYDIGAFEGT
jgi:uncharacterized protein (DUF1330 family)